MASAMATTGLPLGSSDLLIGSQMAGDYTTFGKLAQLLATVTDALPQYEDLLKFCVEQGRNTDDEANPHRMRNHIEGLYEEIFRMLRVAAGSFIKPDGSEKKAAVVALVIWHASESSKKIARAAAERNVETAERGDAVPERRLAERERDLMREERERNAKNRLEVLSRLDDVQRQMRALEKERLDSATRRTWKWTSPSFADRHDRARKLRGRGTTRWLFEEKSYRDWASPSIETPAVGRRFGSNVLWIQGHPGAGKTVLAAAVIEELALGDLTGGGSRPAVYYYFFQHQSPESCRPSDAFRSFLAQLLQKRRDNQQLLDRLTFLVDRKGQGQMSATDAELIDALRLCLEDDAILVLDGVDESDDSESLVESLVRLSRELPALCMLLLSRVNVSALGLSVHADMTFTMPKAKIAPDIYRFFMDELQDMMDKGSLPSLSTSKREALADRLCHGADGMFLWARLMSRCLCSPYMTREQRLDMIDQVHLPEGLEKMYERIVAVTHTAGPSAVNLASKALTWLAFSVLPITSRRLRRAVSAQKSIASQGASADVSEFEGCVIMACVGLVEPTRIDSNPECPQGESALRFYHCSLHELINGISSAVQPPNPVYAMLRGPEISFPVMPTAGQGFKVDSPRIRSLEPYPMQEFGNVSVFQPLITPPVVANLTMAACCLQHLSYHSPAQPLSGQLSNRVSEAYLNETYCFTSLSIFFAKLRVLSSWLEAFYTSQYQRRAVDYKHPPLFIVRGWIELIAMTSSSGQVRMDRHVQEVQETVRALALDMKTIVRTWDLQLEKTPNIIWDEMTYFAKSKFFFSPESIKVSIQGPEPPRSRGVAKEPVARMSKTSADGNVKGLLCIWAPHEIHDRYTLTKLRVTDRNRLPTSGGYMDLDAEDVLGPLRKYLDYPITDSLDFPLAISADAMSVCILHTMYTIQPGTDESDSRIFSQRLSENKYFEPDFMWTAPDQIAKATTDYYNVYFSQTGQDSNKDVSSQINELEISSRAEKVGHFCFHPSRALLVFSETGERMSYACYWAILGTPSRSFSSCGNFLVIQRDFASNAQPEVIKCPGILPEDGQQLPTSENPACGALIGASIDEDAESAALVPRASLGSQLIQKAEAPHFLTQVAVSKTGTEISLV
ncbi:hypothetical protein DL769_003502 [Monosporascus sp. CRB-8-3]|nr:hypothetical protein DL769_003502 [Monosporascus sp. CRB-8-3]